MGCDIHFVIEYKHNDKWVGVYSTGTELPKRGLYHGEEDDSYQTSSHHPILASRNYDFFAALAGVRGEGPEPNGIPEDASDLAILRIEGWGQDGHSHGHCDLGHFCRTWLETNQEFAARTMRDKLKKPDMSPIDLHFPYIDINEEYRVVYWFDN